MSQAELGKYADWIVANKDKKGTPEFETVADAYKALRDKPSGLDVPEYYKRGTGIKTDKKQTEAKEKDEQMFDRTTGIKNAKLRASLSVAEKDSEKIKILKKFGLSDNDFTQDNRGQFALTPSGAKQFGVETDKNVIIDESGLSRYDFADLAGIVPEVGGAIAGGLKGAATGAAVGSAVPIIGTGIGALFGGALGAGAGAATASVAEEAGEAIVGVNDQTAGEVAKDAGREALWAAGGELAFGTPFLLFSKLAPKSSIPQQGGQLFDDAGLATERGFQLTKKTLGLSPILARTESLAESVTGFSARMTNNHKAMVKNHGDWIAKLQALRASSGDKSAGELLRDVIQSPTGPNAEIIRAEREALKSILKSVKDSADTISNGLNKNSQINQDALKNINQAFKVFEEASEVKFGQVNAILDDITGTTNFVPTQSLKEVGDGLMLNYPTGALNVGEAAIERRVALQLQEQLQNLGGKTSFKELYTLRKTVNDLLHGNVNVAEGAADDVIRNIVANSKIIRNSQTLTTGYKYLLNNLDDLLTTKNLDSLVQSTKLPKGFDKKALKSASNSLDEARSFYAQGMKDFQEVQRATGYKDLIDNARVDGSIPNIKGFVLNLIENNKPTKLNSLKKAIGNDKTYNNLKKRIGEEWTRNALTKTGFGSTIANKFRPNEFIDQVNKLGSTGEELFGTAGYKKLKQYASKFQDLKVSKIDEQLLATALANGLEESGDIVSAVRRALDVSKTYSDDFSGKTFRRILRDQATPEETANLITAQGTTLDEIGQIMNYYKGNNEALSAIRTKFLEDMTDDIGVTISAKDMGQWGDRILKADLSGIAKTPGKLKLIFGDEEAKSMVEFGRVLKLMSKDTASGDLVAGNIVTNFLSNIPKIARIFVIGQIMSSKRAHDDLNRAWRQSRGLPVDERPKFLSNAWNTVLRGLRQTAVQQTQSGVDEAKSQVKAVIKNTPQVQQLGNQLSNLQQNISQPNPAFGLGQVNVAQPQPRLATNPSIIGSNPNTQLIAQRLNQGKI
tara:strand:+ start:2796 stop:5855 length:3060 start_codon:yes stop_codon:yes gene_type:complete